MAEEPVVAAAPVEPVAPVVEPVVPAEAPSLVDMIPEDLKDKPWVKENTDTPENFFKFVDNQNKLVGSKAGVVMPEEGAPQEDFDKYFKGIGRPDTAEEYDISSIEELKDVERNEEFDGKLKGLLHTIGVPKDMASKLVKGYDQIKLDMGNAAEDAADADFDKFNTDFFGDKKEEIVANAQKILKGVVNEKALPIIDKMNPEQLALVIAITDGVYSKYGKEDGFRGGEPGSAPVGGETMEQLSAEQRTLMAEPGYKDWRDPKHAEIQAKNLVILNKMRAIKK